MMKNGIVLVGQKQLEQGIHLHWAMSDALMTGEEVHSLDDELAEEIPSVICSISSLPDRWLFYGIET